MCYGYWPWRNSNNELGKSVLSISKSVNQTGDMCGNGNAAEHCDSEFEMNVYQHNMTWDGYSRDKHGLRNGMTT